MSDTTVNENNPVRKRQAVDCFVEESTVNKADGLNKGKTIFQTRRFTTTKHAVTIFTRAFYVRQTPRVTALSPCTSPHTSQMFGLNGHINRKMNTMDAIYLGVCTCFVGILPVFVTRTANDWIFDIASICVPGPCYEQRGVSSYLQLYGNCPEMYIFLNNFHVRVPIATGTHVCWFTHYRKAHSPPPMQMAGPRT
jgi:hypothetical protein